jgi:hypothetical protein
LPALPTSRRPIFDTLFTQPLCRIVIDQVLSPALPSSLSLELLQDYSHLLAAATDFETELARLGLGTTDSIAAWVADVGTHWAQRVSERVVTTIHGLVVRAQWETVVVESRSAKLRQVSRRHRPGKPSVDSTTSPRTSLDRPPSPPVPASAPSPPVLASVPPAGIEGETEEDAWGLDAEPPSPAMPAPVAAKAPTPLLDDGDDAWGFDEDAAAVGSVPPSPLPVASTSKLSNGRHTRQPSAPGGEDAWGFDDADVVPVTPEMPSPAVVADDNGWGLDSPTLSVPPSPRSPARPKHAKRESIAAWTWEEDDTGTADPEPVAKKPPSRARRKPQLGAIAVDKRKPDVETFTISTSTKQVLATAADLLADARKLQAVECVRVPSTLA